MKLYDKFIYLEATSKIYLGIIMTTDIKTFLRIMFQNKILKADGQAFENLFTEIMQYAEDDFLER
jgi:hypothetical protein